MEEKKPDPLQQSALQQPAAQPRRDTEHPEQPAPTQHDLMHKALPKKDVAKGLEEFDGDEG